MTAKKKKKKKAAMLESLARKVGRRIGICGLHHLQCDSPALILRHHFSTKREGRSVTVSYLVSHCGISSNRAPALSKYVNFETLDQPNSVLRFFREQHFSEPQISNVVKGRPRILLSNPSKTLLPKLQYLRSLGFSSPQVANVISACPIILSHSLKNQWIPCLELYIKHYQSKDEAVAAINQAPTMLTSTLHRHVIPVLEALRHAGVPERAISMFICKHPYGRWVPDRFRRAVAEVLAMGIDPTKSIFIEAVAVLSYITKSSWEEKLALYGKWGWSKEQALVAFRKWPRCFRISEVKIMGVMNLFVNKLGWESSFVAKNPLALSYSLGKRLLPRAFVLQYLDSEGLLPYDLSSPKLAFFVISENKFLEKYVLPYSEPSSLLTMYLQKKSGSPSSLDRETTTLERRKKKKKKKKRKKEDS